MQQRIAPAADVSRRDAHSTAADRPNARLGSRSTNGDTESPVITSPDTSRSFQSDGLNDRETRDGAAKALRTTRDIHPTRPTVLSTPVE